MKLHGFVLLLLGPLSLASFGKQASPAADDPVLEARMVQIANELRCLVCQNQSIAESNAPLADDLRQQVRSQIVAGKSDADIVAYLTARYGDFVLYRPQFKPITALLWLAPALLVVVGIVIALRFGLRRRAAEGAVVDQAALQRLLGEPRRKQP